MKKTVLESIFAMLVAMVLILVASVISAVASDTKHSKEMNEQEVHYDADGLFIMIDKEHGLMGLYDGNKVIDHMNIDTDEFEIGTQNIPIVVYGKE